MFERLEENVIGRDFVVGDIHGMFPQLRKALNEVSFDTEKDRLIFVGDLIDRGTHSRDALAWLKQPWTKSLQGNHEIMLVMAYRAVNYMDECEPWMARCWQSDAGGGQWAYYIYEDEYKDEFREWYDILVDLPLAMEIPVNGKMVGLTHAEIPNGYTWDQTKKILMEGGDPSGRLIETISWGRPRFQKYKLIKEHFNNVELVEHDLHRESLIEGIHCVIQGHTPIGNENFPLIIGNNVYIDVSRSVLNQQGEFKLINLQEFIEKHYIFE